MKLIKALLSIILLSVIALYARQYYSLLPKPLINALQYLPILLIVFVTTVSIYFNQTKIFLSVLLISFLYVCIDYDWLNTDLKITLFATFTPILLLITYFLKKQSLTSVKSLPIYFIYFFALLFALWIIDHQPDWANQYLFLEWIPEQYFDWSKLTQLALGLYVTVFISMLLLFSKHQNSQNITAIIMLVCSYILIQIKFSSSDLIILMTTIMLQNLIVLLQASRHMAYIDELTLLPGRRALEEKLQSLMGIYSIAMVDIDHFKKFNDKYGHDTGDDVLRMIAVKLNKVTGGGTAYRYGGEEFTIVFANKSTEQIIEDLESLRENIANTKFVVNRRTNSRSQKKDTTVKITVSIGVKDSININSSKEVLKQADLALYKSKKKGRNCIS